MLTTIGSPNIALPPPVQTVAVLAATSPSLASNQIPFQSVASSYSSSAAFNNTRGSVLAQPSASATSVASVSQSAARSSALSSPVTFGFSTPFMAQLIAQGGSNDNLVQSFIQSLPEGSATLDRDTLESFSLIKYLPSNASAPPPAPKGVAQLSPPPVQQPQQVQAQPQPAMVSEPVRVAPVSPSLDSIQVSQRVSGYGGYLPAAPSSERALPREVTSNSEPIRIKSSLIRPRGVEAYAATGSRNSENLTPVEPVKAADADFRREAVL